MNGIPRPNYLLITLTLVLLASLPWIGSRLGFGPDAAVTAPRPARSARIERPGASPGDRIAALRLANLERAPRPSTSGRDPWRFIDPPPRPAQTSLAKSKAPASAAGPLAIELDPPPHPRDFPLLYLGHFGPPDKQLAVFTNGHTIFNLQEGDVIDNQFLLTHIGHESVDIRFVGFPDTPAKRIGVRGNPG